MTQRTPREQLPLGFETRRSYGRDAFVPGATNEAALSFIDSWPDWPARVCVVWGPKGSGKTHLAHVWGARAEAQALSMAQLSVDVVARLPGGGAFVIDDANRHDGGAPLFHLINLVNQTSGWLLMTGSEPPQRWKTTLPDLHSRLTAVPGIALEAPDETLLARALLKLFADRQLKLPEALIDYLVPRLQRSFAEAERIAAIIDTLALQQKRNISVEIGAQALRQLEGERGARSADNGEGLV